MLLYEWEQFFVVLLYLLMIYKTCNSCDLLIKFLIYIIFDAEFLGPKSGNVCENEPVLGHALLQKV